MSCHCCVFIFPLNRNEFPECSSLPLVMRDVSEPPCVFRVFAHVVYIEAPDMLTLGPSPS